MMSKMWLDVSSWARKWLPFIRDKNATEADPGDPEHAHIPEASRRAENVITENIVRPAFKQLFPRGPITKYDSIMSPEYIKLMADINCTKSTAEGLSEYLSLEKSQQQPETLAQNPLECLFAIIQFDISNVLHLMDLALNEFRHHMLDDIVLQQRLIQWRHLLNTFLTKIDWLEASLQHFTNFLKCTQHSLPNSVSVEARIKQCFTDISLLKQRTERTNKALMANMSIIESERAIAEAESVTKLSELAFLFIPLAFSATLFSMQVKELTERSVPLWAFFILAASLTTCSYLLRLILRSQRLIRYRQKLSKRIREDMGIQPGDQISTVLFFRWVSTFWWYVAMAGLIVGLLAGLIGTFFTHYITPIVILVVLLAIFVVFVCFSFKQFILGLFSNAHMMAPQRAGQKRFERVMFGLKKR